MKNTWNRTRRALVAATLLICSCVGAHAGLSGKVVGVIDGDTLDVLVPASGDAAPKPLRVRLAKIDAPERAQPFGSRARQELSTLVYGQAVDVELVGIDRRGRSVGNVRRNGMDINHEMVARGMAWAFRRYLSGDLRLLEIEADARQAGRGLWADPRPVAPWEWRSERRNSASTAVQH